MFLCVVIRNRSFKWFCIMVLFTNPLNRDRARYSIVIVRYTLSTAFYFNSY